MNPLISIIIPSYNRANLISDTLNSVIAQTYLNWECIVIDDGSSDGTNSLIKEYIHRDKRIKYFTKPVDLKQGASISRNYGLKKAAGDYIQFLDSDDILADNKLESQISLLVPGEKFTISTCKWGIFTFKDEPLKLFEEKRDYRSFDNVKDYFDLIGEIGGYFPPHCFLVSKDLICFSGQWNENLTLNDDGEFFFRILLNSSKILFAKDTYVRYRNKNEQEDNLRILNSKIKAQHLVNSWRIIEALYLAKYQDSQPLYLNKKKESIYFGIKRFSPKVITENRQFFHKEIGKDTLGLKLGKLRKRIGRRLIIIFRQK
ncbi:MAG: glycosyltransferase family 2 protein [Bacteroidota bacterium]